jgi:hypothetical protein
MLFTTDRGVLADGGLATRCRCMCTTRSPASIYRVDNHIEGNRVVDADTIWNPGQLLRTQYCRLVQLPVSTLVQFHTRDVLNPKQTRRSGLRVYKRAKSAPQVD